MTELGRLSLLFSVLQRRIPRTNLDIPRYPLIGQREAPTNHPVCHSFFSAILEKWPLHRGKSASALLERRQELFRGSQLNLERYRIRNNQLPV